MAPKGKSDNTTYLMNEIAEIYLLLQGKYIDGKDTTFGSMFETTRYAIILLVGITVEHFKDKTIIIDGTPFYNIYRLEKVADFLHLDYDRKRQAKKIYEDLEKKGDLKKIVTEEHKTYVTLTEKGIKECKKRISEARQLMEYFLKNPSLRHKYTTDLLTSTTTKEPQYKCHELTEEEAEVERLVKSVSEWT